MTAAAQYRRKAQRGGCLIKLLVLLVAVAAAGALTWMLYLPIWVTDAIKAQTGCDATVASLSCNPFGGKLVVRGLVISNPTTWPTRDFVEMREFVAEGDLWSLWAERLELDSLTVDVRRLTLVRRADGKSNAELLRPAPASAPGTKVSVPAPTEISKTTAGATAPGRKFLIRRMTLRFDRLVIADFTGPAPVFNEHVLALDQRYENIMTAQQLVVPEVLRRVAAENLGPTLGRLVPGELGLALGASAREAAAGGAELLKGAGQRANELLQGLREKLEETRKP